MNIDTRYSRNRAYISKNSIHGFVTFYVLIGIILIGLSPWISSSAWIGSSDFHSGIKIVGSLVAIIAGIFCLLHFISLRSRFYLTLSLGFFISGSGDFVYGLIGIGSLFNKSSGELSKVLPATFFIGQLIFVTILIFTILLEDKLRKIMLIKNEALILITSATFFGVGITFFTTTLKLPRFIYPEMGLSRPFDFILALLFCLAFLLLLQRYLRIRDIFSGMILSYILLNLGCHIYLAFSKQLYDSFFNVAHWIKLVAYCMPVLGIVLHELEKIKKSGEEITQRKKIEEKLVAKTDELQRINRELKSFMSIYSHDLKSPLRGIYNLSLWIMEDLKHVLTTDTREYLNLIRRRIKRMEELLDGLLIYSSVEKIHYPIKPVSTELMIKEIIESLHLPADINIEINTPMPDLHTIKEHLQQVFSNLITNAIKHHCSKNGNIIICSRDNGSVYEFSVADDGPGIDPQFHQKVFQLFQTLKPRDRFESRGMGLALVKKILEYYKCTIVLESNEGQGSIFKFTWPKKMQTKELIRD